MLKSALAVLSAAVQRLHRANIEEAELDAKYIVSHVLDVSVHALYTEKTLTVDHRKTGVIDRMLKQRISGMPVQYIIGEQVFCGLTFSVNQKVLIPRPETELLAEKALEKAKPLPSPKILDLCTGSGCIAVVIKSKLHGADITASDISCGALHAAKKNARLNGADIRFIRSNLFRSVKGTFDIIVANPPYISRQNYWMLDRKVREYEPKKALIGGTDGLKMIRAIIHDAKQHLTENGWLLLEIGHDQRSVTEALMTDAGYSDIRTFRDYSGFDRIVNGRSN